MHLDHDSCMEVTVLKGRGSDVQEFADHIIAERGVRHGHVVYMPADGLHDHGQKSGRRATHSHARCGHNHRRRAGSTPRRRVRLLIFTIISVSGRRLTPRIARH